MISYKIVFNTCKQTLPSFSISLSHVMNYVYNAHIKILLDISNYKKKKKKKKNIQIKKTNFLRKY